MAQLPGIDALKPVLPGRLRERESPFPMIPVDEAIGQVLREAVPLEAVTTKLADIPTGMTTYNDCAFRVLF